MQPHEREFYIATIRSGKFFLPDNIIIHSPSLEQQIESCSIYNASYDQALNDGFMTVESMFSWMKEQYLWTSYNDKKLEEVQTSISNLKVDIYSARTDKKRANVIRGSIRQAEDMLRSLLTIKNQHYHCTCEGLADSDKLMWLIQHLTFINNNLYDFTNTSIDVVINQWHGCMLSETQCRHLARNDPWRSLWNIHERSCVPLFHNHNITELNHNQKHLMIWSQMYDNIQESMDCPTKNVIEDDDMLDGWFITQSRKREKDQLDREFENNASDKLKQANSVFLMADSPDQVADIQKRNSEQSQAKIQAREKQIIAKGVVQEQDFADQKMAQYFKQLADHSNKK